MLSQTPGRFGDTAELGSAVHAGIMDALLSLQAEVEPSFADANAAAQRYWSGIWQAPGWATTEIATEAEGAQLAYDCLERWWHEILPSLYDEQILGIEQRFDVAVFSDSMREIRLQGTYDLETNVRIWDWKTSDGAYSGSDRWKYERHYKSVQHVLYPWALSVRDDTAAKPFRYCVIPRNGKPTTDILELEPTSADRAFLLEELLGWAYLVEAQLPQWPLGPTDWWCSSKWCELWSECRGKHLGEDPWGLLEKVEIKLSKKGKK